MSLSSTISPIFNYTIRGLIIVFGMLLLLGVIAPPRADAAMTRIFGIVFILFGIYRIATYYTAQKRFAREQERE